MNYLESLAYIESLSPATQTPCFERMQAFMSEHGCLQDSFESIHIGGTNGKGSTVAILDSILRKEGLKVGRFTGPHLLHWNERFHLNGKPVADDYFADLATKIRLLSQDFAQRHSEYGPLTWFEFLTAIAFFYFAENKVDIAVLEVGLGGRFDATNVISNPLAAAITNVDLDHTQILGETVQAIASEKAGIIKQSKPIVTAAEHAALDVIASTAQTFLAPLFHCSADTISLMLDNKTSHQKIMSIADSPKMLEAYTKLSLIGKHQQTNALVAQGILMASGLAKQLCNSKKFAEFNGPITWSHLLVPELNNVYWPGRLQYLASLNLILDGSHNPSGARALKQALDDYFPDKKRLFIIGCFQNKDVPAYIRSLVRPIDQVIACEATSRRAVFPAQQIVDIVKSQGAQAIQSDRVDASLKLAFQMLGAEEIIIATGSFAIIAEVMLKLGWSQVEDGIELTSMICTQPAYQLSSNP